MSHRIQHRTGKSFLISVILSITLFTAVLGMKLLAGFMNRRIFVTDIRQSGYGTYAAEEMLAQQKKLFAEYHLPEEIAEELFEKEKSYRTFSTYVDGKSVDKTFGVKEAVYNYLDTYQISCTDELDASISVLVSESENLAARYLYPDFVTEYRELCNRLFLKTVILTILMTAVSIILMMILYSWYKSSRHALQYLGGAGICVLIWNAVLTILLVIHQSDIAQDMETHYQAMYQMFIKSGIRCFYVADAILAMLIIVIVSIILMKKSRN